MTCEISDVECINCEEPHCLKDAYDIQREYKSMEKGLKQLEVDLKELQKKITKTKTAIKDYYKENKDEINDHRTWMY